MLLIKLHLAILTLAHEVLREYQDTFTIVCRDDQIFFNPLVHDCRVRCHIHSLGNGPPIVSV